MSGKPTAHAQTQWELDRLRNENERLREQLRIEKMSKARPQGTTTMFNAVPPREKK